MTTQQSADDRLVGVLGDATHELVMTGLTLARESTRGSVLLLAGIAGGVRDLTLRVTGSADESVRSLGSTIRARLADTLELRMTRLLNSFHIPTSGDISELSNRVEQLHRELEKLNTTQPRRSVRARGAKTTGSRKSNGRGA